MVEPKIRDIKFASFGREWGVKQTKSSKKESVFEGPSPGTYDSEKSIRLTQWFSRTVKFKGPKNISYADMESKRKSYIPGVGHYKKVESAYNVLSKLPISIRKLR